MKRIAAFTLLVALGVAGAMPAQAQSKTVEDNSRQSEAAREQRKMLKKAAKKQRKDMKRAAKAQRKAQKANRQAR
jgi:uncharacterized protein HemX